MNNREALGLDREPTTLVQLLRARSHQQPHDRNYTFLLDGESATQSWSYAALDQQARATAALLQEHVPAGERVLLLYPPGLEYIAAFFGCLYAGVVAVPVYPPSFSRPALRLQAVLEDAGANTVLTTERLLGESPALIQHTPSLAGLRWLATDKLPEQLASRWRPVPVDAESLAFLQYTSGSTGTPRGVMLSHGNLLHNLSLIYRFYGMSPASQGVIWLVPYHDMGLIGGILAPLYGGFPVTLLSPVAFLQRPLRWLEAISRYRGTISGGPNFAYSLCLNKISAEDRQRLDLSSWQVAFNGAEPVRADTMARFAEAFGPCGFRHEAFYPCYGLAEATLIVSGGAVEQAPLTQTIDAAALAQHRVAPAQPGQPAASALVSSGRSAPDQQVLIVDPELRVPLADRVGEIWVRGPSVAQGYWNQPAQSAETFQARLADGQTGPFLRTGDLGFLQDGELFVTGRLKDLIIIRGKNHYPQDIELTVERSHPALAPGCGAAFAVEADGEEQLVVVQELSRHHRNVDPEQVTQAVRAAVAEQHGLQVHAVVLIRPASILKTTSGKIQRRACKAAYLEGSLAVIGQSTLEPSQEPEQAAPAAAALRMLEPAQRLPLIADTLHQQVARLLRLSPARLSRDQPLISLGLDSLQSLELSQGIGAMTGVEIEATDLLDGMSVQDLAERIAAGLDRPQARAASGPHPLPAQAPERRLLSFAQQRMWFLERLSPGNAAYHIPAALRLTGALDQAALERSLSEIVRRHEVLRTVFELVDGQPLQRFLEPAPLPLVRHDLSGLAPEAQAEAVRELSSASARQPFDLGRGPLLRTWLLRLAPEQHILLVCLHHIVADGWSMGVLVGELVALYTAFSAGQPAALAELPIQYADFGAWQRQQLQGEALGRQLGYWRETLADAPRTLALPTDLPRPDRQTFAGRHIGLSLPAELCARLRALGQREQATLYMTLLAGFVPLLHYHTRQERVVVGMDIANRNSAATRGLIGFFANQLVLCTDLSGDPTFAELLRRVRRVTLGAYAHQDVPFNKIVEALQPERDPSRNPLFQVLFVLENSPIPRLNLPGLSAEVLETESPGSPFDMSLLLTESADAIGGMWRYNSQLFSETSVRRMIQQYQALLEAATQRPDAPLSALLGQLDALAQQARQSQAAALRAAASARFARITQNPPTASQD